MCDPTLFVAQMYVWSNPNYSQPHIRMFDEDLTFAQFPFSLTGYDELTAKIRPPCKIKSLCSSGSDPSDITIAQPFFPGNAFPLHTLLLSIQCLITILANPCGHWTYEATLPPRWVKRLEALHPQQGTKEETVSSNSMFIMQVSV